MMQKRLLLSLILLLGLLISCSQKRRLSDDIDRTISSRDLSRGSTADFDWGPNVNTDYGDKLARLFAETPNYRRFGQEVIGGRGEKFRWKFGPMWYRGRLEKDAVKVFIIGQEGAQDENVSNRSFTGSTGTKMQKFLNHLGITESYLFMNTFVYTITGQYSLFGEDRNNKSKLDQQQNLLWLAQDSDSIVVQHRHELFDTVLENNDELSVVIGVGTAGKDSTATYANHLNGNSKCSNSRVGNGGCYVKYKGRNILFMGVPHPGGASPRNGGEAALKRLLSSFDRQAKVVLEAIDDDKIKLRPDRGGRRGKLSQRYRYGNAPVPHKDFAFGTNWRMGKSGTTSNRRGSHTIQVFSDNGCYNNAKKVNGRCGTSVDNIRYDDPADLLSSAPKEMEKCDVPYESPKICYADDKRYQEFDPGPGELSRVLVDFFEDIPWNDIGVEQHLSFGHTGIYRGWPTYAKILVIADQHSHDDFFSGRALTGEIGQRFQTKLNEYRAEDKEYLIIRTAPVDTLELPSDLRREILLENRDVNSARERVIEKALSLGSIEKVVGLGEYASEIAEKVAKKHRLKWETYSTSAVKKMPLNIIPRWDLPSHTRFWMGTSGNRAAQGYRRIRGKKVYSGDYYKIYVPRWASKWPTGSLSSEERDSLETF